MTAANSPLTATPYPTASSNAVTDLLQVPSAVLWLEKYVNLRFATEAARDAAIPTPEQGMVAYSIADDAWKWWNGTAWTTMVTGVWTAYTPTLANITLGTGGTVTGRWKRLDPHTAVVRVSVNLGSAGIAVGPTPPNFTLPTQVPIDASYALNDTVGVSNLIDTSASSAGRISGGLYVASAASPGNVGWSSSGGAVTNLVPFTWAVSDRLVAQCVYECGIG